MNLGIAALTCHLMLNRLQKRWNVRVLQVESGMTSIRLDVPSTAWNSPDRRNPLWMMNSNYLLFSSARYKTLNIPNESELGANCFSLHYSGLSVKEIELIKIKYKIEWTKVSGSMKVPRRINWHNLWASIGISTCTANRLHADEMLEKKRDFHDYYHVHRQQSPRTHTYCQHKTTTNNAEISYHPINIHSKTFLNAHKYIYYFGSKFLVNVLIT